MKKKELLVAACSLLIIGSLTSCFFLGKTVIDIGQHEGTTSSSTNFGTDSSYNATYKTPSYGSNDSKDNINIQNVGKGFGYNYLPSKGSPSILVIPIQFSDDSFTTTELSRLNNTFFGEASDTGWESVKSFYETSSYGKLSLTGGVSDVVTLNQTVSELEESSKNYSSGNYTDVILRAALNALVSNNFDLSPYDTNNDSYIDAIWMVYSTNYDSDSDLYWAFTTWTGLDNKYDSKYYASTYSWASIDFATEGKYLPTNSASNGDAHTFIHETGHMMGLDDYYSYDYDGKSNYDTPTGGVDMMDFNIGDHDAYSKYVLGWSTPTVIDEEYLSNHTSTLTLKDFESTGESYLLPIYKDGSTDYNETAFDEYLLIELYTPTGLNDQDAYTTYTGNLRAYSEPGILVFHVNSKLGKLTVSNKSLVWDGATYDKLPAISDWGNYSTYFYIYSNTRSYCYDTRMCDTKADFYRGRLNSLISATGERIQGRKTGYASNSSLFTSHSSFGSNGTYSNFVFDDGNKPQYGFEVNSVNETQASLTFSDF